VRSASGQQAELGVGVNLNKLLICLFAIYLMGAGELEESCVFIDHRAGRILLGTKTIAMEYDFMLSQNSREFPLVPKKKCSPCLPSEFDQA